MKRGERSRERTFQITLEREQEAAERSAGVTKIGLSPERQISRSRSAHMLCSAQQPVWKGFCF